MEHAHPLDRPFPWRTLALAASVLALGAGSVVALVERPSATGAAPDSHQARQGPALPPLRARSGISVLVLNGNGMEGAAGTKAAVILSWGYQHAIPSDAPQLTYARSVVLFRPGWQREAERLAKDARIRAVATLDGRIAPPYAHVPLILILGAK